MAVGDLLCDERQRCRKSRIERDRSMIVIDEKIRIHDDVPVTHAQHVNLRIDKFFAERGFTP